MKRILALILVFIFALSMSAMAVDVEIKDAGKDIVTVSGKIGKEGLVSVMILNPGFTKDDVLTRGSEAVQYYATANEGSDGFSLDVRMTDPHEYEGGKYTVVFSNGTVTKTESFVFYFSGKKTELIQSLNKFGASGLSGEIYKVYSLDTSDIYKDVSASSLERVLSAKGKIEEDVDKMYAALLDTLHIAAYSEGSDVLVKDGKLAYVDVVGIDKEVTYKDYLSNLSDSGINAVNEAVLGGEYEKDEDITKAFSNAVVLNCITNSASMGFGHVEDVFEKYDKLLSEQGIDTGLLNDVDNKNYVYKKLATSSDKSFEAFKATYLEAIDDADGQYESSSGGSSGGSKGSSGKVSIPFGGPGQAVVSGQQNGSGYLENYDVPFEDMTDAKWAQEAVASLYKRNIISGKSEKVFDPSGLVTREEFAKMAVLAFVGGAQNIQNPFADVSGWSAPYVATAHAKGIIQGISDTVFAPSNNITREQAATIIARAMKSAGYVFNKEPVAFDDDDSVSSWAKESVGALTGEEIINGRGNGIFAPTENMTRAEAAKLIYTAMTKTGGINQ